MALWTTLVPQLGPVMVLEGAQEAPSKPQKPESTSKVIPKWLHSGPRTIQITPTTNSGSRFGKSKGTRKWGVLGTSLEGLGGLRDTRIWAEGQSGGSDCHFGCLGATLGGLGGSGSCGGGPHKRPVCFIKPSSEIMFPSPSWGSWGRLRESRMPL